MIQNSFDTWTEQPINSSEMCCSEVKRKAMTSGQKKSRELCQQVQIIFNWNCLIDNTYK